LIQTHLRDRLFEISRRNRLVYFKPTVHSLNLTMASFPVDREWKEVARESLFLWHPELMAALLGGAPVSLTERLPLEDSGYIAGALDKLISEARRDRTEYGFAQLRLVVCFLIWHDLKNAPEERIQSPLLLLPVELMRRKGIRDQYVLDPSGGEVEVNPVLRHHLKELYGLELPEAVDLKATAIEQFHEQLRGSIQASEPKVGLSRRSEPQMDQLQHKARQREELGRRRLNRRPGEKLRVETGETEGRLEGVEAGDSATNVELRYAWELDMVNFTLGNFNYRKMTLVRDYAQLIETDMASGAFDAVFSVSPRRVNEEISGGELRDQHWVIPCDASQAAAVDRARAGGSYIIQGPPGTGKSQTITNLIGDYVARGKRVLFVCEKRAAIDVVFQRLSQQGLDELCCLIHDSQTDKKAFIQDLKHTYEKMLGTGEADVDVGRLRAAKLKSMETWIAELRQFSVGMHETREVAGVSLRALLHRLVEVGARENGTAPELEELLPDYALWLRYGDVIERLREGLLESSAAEAEIRFAEHPLRWLGNEVLRAERPVEMLLTQLDRAEELLEYIQRALTRSKLPSDLWDTFEEIQALLTFAVRVRPLAERGLLGALSTGESRTAFDALAGELDSASERLRQAKEKTGGWREALSVEDTVRALELARGFEGSVVRFLRPSYWRLSGLLKARYDFSRHAVEPSWTKILEELTVVHRVEAETRALRERAAKSWNVEDVETFRRLVREIRDDPRTRHPSIQRLLALWDGKPEARAQAEDLAEVHDRLAELDQTLGRVVVGHEALEFVEVSELLEQLREQSDLLAEMSSILSEVADLPEPLARALRLARIGLGEFEVAMGQKSVNRVYREDRVIRRFDSRSLALLMERLERDYRDWLALNARCIRQAVRRRFLEHVQVSSLPAAQLNAEQKLFKKAYASGRRELEHEFGKTMRYRSIRDLAADETGCVIQDLKPIWLMSPLSVSDTLPLDPGLFDVVIFDEASQIPVEEAVPALYRSNQVIVVGDEMQLPPTQFFATARADDEVVTVEEEGEVVEVSMDSESFLSQAARNLPSTLLAWHYRSRHEALISFSNAAFYGGQLRTIPDRQCVVASGADLVVKTSEQGDSNVEALLARSISFHFMEGSVYEERQNLGEAAYIARLVRGVIRSESRPSVGVVAFSEAQQGAIESALEQLAREDADFGAQLESEYVREEGQVFCGLFVKNLENVQGDERDIILMSICYGPDAKGRMQMNFGPINQRGGEKRLNVIFSRARHRMAIVSSIRHDAITNDHNVGASRLKQFLRYAEAASRGDNEAARRVLESVSLMQGERLESAASERADAVVERLAAALRDRGHEVDVNVGESRFRCDLAVRSSAGDTYRLGILVDTAEHYRNPDVLDRYLMQPSILRAFGWRIVVVLTKDWHQGAEAVLERIEKALREDR